MNSVTNKVVYITGGTKGIGLGISKAILNAGGKVAFTSRHLEDAQSVANEIGTAENVLALESNVKNFESEQKAFQKAKEHFGKIDVVIANAGIGKFAPIDELTLEQWQNVIDVNLTGVFHTTKAAIPYLKESKGYLITIASLAGTNFFEKGAAYNASKFGVVGFTQAVMLDLRKYDIKTSTIMPGSVATHFNENIPSEKDDWKIQPEDIGKIVVNLLTMDERVLPSKIEVRPSFPHKKKK